MHATSLEYVALAGSTRWCHSAHHDQGQNLAKEQVRGKSSAASSNVIMWAFRFGAAFIHSHIKQSNESELKKIYISVEIRSGQGSQTDHHSPQVMAGRGAFDVSHHDRYHDRYHGTAVLQPGPDRSARPGSRGIPADRALAGRPRCHRGNYRQPRQPPAGAAAPGDVTTGVTTVVITRVITGVISSRVRRGAATGDGSLQLVRQTSPEIALQIPRDCHHR